MDAPEPGGLGGTYAGNPVACAAALGVFDAFEQDKLLEKAEKQGKIMMERLKAIKAKGRGMPMGDMRGLGAMVAFELVTEHGGNKPDAAGAKALAAKCLERGLLILTCGVYGDTIRLLTPLTASKEDPERGPRHPRSRHHRELGGRQTSVLPLPGLVPGTHLRFRGARGRLSVARRGMRG